MSERETTSTKGESDSTSKKQKLPEDASSHATNSTESSSLPPVNSLTSSVPFKNRFTTFKQKTTQRFKLFFKTLRGIQAPVPPAPVTEAFRIEVPSQGPAVVSSMPQTTAESSGGRRLSYQRRVLEAQAAREIAELKTKMLKAEQARLEAEKERQLEQTALEKKKLKAEKMLIHAKLLEGIALLDGEGQESTTESPHPKTNTTE